MCNLHSTECLSKLLTSVVCVFFSDADAIMSSLTCTPPCWLFSPAHCHLTSPSEDLLSCFYLPTHRWLTCSSVPPYAVSSGYLSFISLYNSKTILAYTYLSGCHFIPILTIHLSSLRSHSYLLVLLYPV